MNTDSANPNKIRHVSFNEDYTSLAVCTNTDYTIFSLDSVHSWKPIYNKTIFEDVHIVERLNNSCLLALVTKAFPKELRILHLGNGLEICKLLSSNDIFAVKLNRERLIVCLETSLHIYNIKDIKFMHRILNLPPNLHRLCSLTMVDDHCLLAFPISSTTGEITILDAINFDSERTIETHEGPLSALAFSHQGTRIAAASEKHLVIRIFDVNDGSKLYEFQQRTFWWVTVRSMVFSLEGMYLCCSSNLGTVHVFRLNELQNLRDSEVSSEPANDVPALLTDESTHSPSTMEYISGTLSSVATNYLPNLIRRMFNYSSDALVSVNLPHPEMRNICGSVVIEGVLRLLVASWDGYLYVYNVDTTENSECLLWKKHRIQLDNLGEGFLVDIPDEQSARNTVTESCHSESEEKSEETESCTPEDFVLVNLPNL